MAHRFAGLKEKGKKVFLYDNNQEKVRQVLWGDWLSIDEDQSHNELGAGWLVVIWGPKSDHPQRLYVKEEETTANRPLEIIFLDVGQGDGAIFISPEREDDERIIVIDAGERDHMRNFLNKRFKAYRGFDFDAAVITHPDKDHYLGFEQIFEDHDIGFKTVYHNGLVERAVAGEFEKLGGVKQDPDTERYYIEDLAETTADIETHFGDTVDLGKYVFPKVMRSALNNPKINNFKILSTHHSQSEDGRHYMPGFAPSDNRGYAIEVLGPLMEFGPTNKPRLRRISSDYGKTKNGHSVILRLHFGGVKVLFGGDLNTQAEKFLLTHYGGLEKFPLKRSDEYYEMLDIANDWFGADVMKVCHHGSEKVTDEFMAAVNPAAFVISSGDSEGHVHPRPDLLGRLGRFGRGKAPVLLATELQRSTREYENEELLRSVLDGVSELAGAPTEALQNALKEKIEELGKSNIEVYGSIYVKTDGERLIAAFKIETNTPKKKWFYFEYQVKDGVLTLS